MATTHCLLASVVFIAGVGCAAADWREALTAKGFTVQEGEYGFFGVEDCADLDTCFASNPATPYAMLFLPRHPAENTANYTGWCAHGICRGNGTLSGGWRVVPGETVLVVGRTPPAAKYWSYTPSILSRYHPPGWRPTTVGTGCARGGKTGNRCEYFASVNDPLNHLTIETSPADNVFAADFAMLVSWDTTGETAVTDVLSSERDAGRFRYPVNNVRYPGAIAKLGVRVGDEDDFIIVNRVDEIASDAEREAYYGGSWPVAAYRISPPAGMPVPAESFHSSFEGKMRTRNTGVPEHVDRGVGVSFDDLRAAVRDVIAAVDNALPADVVTSRVDFTSFVQDSGYECLASDTDCLGDCRDTIYARATLLPREALCNVTHLPSCTPAASSKLGGDDPNDAFYVVGVNHAAAGHSIYSSISAYNYPKLEPVGSMSDGPLRGTAAGYLPAGHPAAPYLYVAKFARTCAAGDVTCVTVPSQRIDASHPLLKETDPTIFIERCYVNPATTSGPAVNETILPVLIHARTAK